MPLNHWDHRLVGLLTQTSHKQSTWCSYENKRNFRLFERSRIGSEESSSWDGCSKGQFCSVIFAFSCWKCASFLQFASYANSGCSVALSHNSPPKTCALVRAPLITSPSFYQLAIVQAQSAGSIFSCFSPLTIIIKYSIIRILAIFLWTELRRAQIFLVAHYSEWLEKSGKRDLVRKRSKLPSKWDLRSSFGWMAPFRPKFSHRTREVSRKRPLTGVGRARVTYAVDSNSDFLAESPFPCPKNSCSCY